MRLEEYIGKKESIICNAQVKQRNAATFDSHGNLVCTDHRAVFFRSQEVIDISLDSITAIEYSPSKWLNKDTLYGISFTLVTFVMTLFRDIPPIPIDIVMLAAFFIGIVAIAYFWEGLVNRSARLTIHTPTDSYDFMSKDYNSVEKVPHAIRQAQT